MFINWNFRHYKEVYFTTIIVQLCACAIIYIIVCHRHHISALIMSFAFSDCKDVFYAVIVTHLCVSAVGYVGNIITCIVIASNKSMRTSTNIYLFNLAVADIIMLTAGLKYYTTTYWYFSKNQIIYKGLQSNCFIVSWILHTSFSVSIMTITALTIERYLAICHPFLARRILSISRAIKLIFVIWIIGIGFGSLVGNHPHIEIEEVKALCKWNSTIPYILETETFVFFALPLVLLILLYILIGRTLAKSSKIQKSQSKNKSVEGSSDAPKDDSFSKKIFKMLITVVAVFFVSWAPFHIGRFGYKNNGIPDTDHSKGYCYLLTIHSVFYFVSSSINPIIYSAMSNKFRFAFKKVWYICICKQMTKVGDLREITENTA